MSNRTTEIKKLHNPKVIVRDKEYYFNTLNIEHDLLKKATDIAERMMVAFMRENKVEVSIDPEDLANRIAEKLGKRVYHPGEYPMESASVPGFNYDDGPVIIKTEKIEVKGNLTSVSKTKDSIKESMDTLGDLEI
jgi:hypothetical protein